MRIRLISLLIAGLFSATHAFAENADINNINKLFRQVPGRFGRVHQANANFISVKNPSDVFPAIANFCRSAYPGNTTAQQECIAELNSLLISKGVVAGGTIYGKYAYFPVNVPGVAVGVCLYLASPYVLGLACAGTDINGTGVVYTGCSIYSGCGSGVL